MKQQEIKMRTTPVWMAALVALWLLVSFSLAAPGITTALAANNAGDEPLIVLENDSGERWSELAQFNIFKGYQYIEPTSGGEYAFTVQNSARFPFRYTLHAEEENPAGVPMKFRLRSDSGEYVAGSETEWVELASLNGVSSELAYETETGYVLEWCWVGNEDDNDTLAGIAAQDDPVYILRLDVSAEQSGEIVPKPGDGDGEEGKPGTDDSNSPQTGDTSNLALPLAMLVCSGIMLLFLLFLRRRENEDQVEHEQIS